MKASSSRTEAPAAPPKKPRRPVPQTTVNLAPEHFKFLEKRGARGDRAHGIFNRSRVLRRKVDLLTEMIERSNPIKTRQFPERYVKALARLVPEPWKLTPAEIAFIDAYVVRQPDFDAVVRAARIDVEDLNARLAELVYAERVALVDLIEQQLAPEASAAALSTGVD